MRPHHSKRIRRIGTSAAAAAALVPLGGCATSGPGSWSRLGQPPGVTDRTDAMQSLWIGAWIAAMLVGIVVWGLIGFACVRYRRRRDDEIPVQTRYNLPIEILYTVAPVVMVLVFFYFTVVTQDKVLASANAASAQGGRQQTAAARQADHTVTAVGFQFSWTFNYVKDPALDGRTTVYDTGTTANPPTLYLPVNRSVLVKLRSPDVVHSFWVPSFLFKMDVIPGRRNSFSFTPTRRGTFIGRCAELCGVYHSRMLFTVKVVSRSQYARHLRRLQQQGNVGLALGGSDATTKYGLQRTGRKEAP